jgi:phage gp36-like protein
VQQRRAWALARKAQVDQLQLLQAVAKGGVRLGVLAALEQRGALRASASSLRQLRNRKKG